MSAKSAIVRKDLTKAIPTDILYELANAFSSGIHGIYKIYLKGDSEPSDRSIEIRLKSGERCNIDIIKSK